MGEDVGRQLALYLHLAKGAELRRQALVRDRLLTVACALAARAGLSAIAEGCRARIVEHNPGHALGRIRELSEALNSASAVRSVRRAQREYPIEYVEHLLANLQIDPAQERATYADDAEYAAALLAALRPMS